jgi:hypothetical protein
MDVMEVAGNWAQLQGYVKMAMNFRVSYKQGISSRGEGILRHEGGFCSVIWLRTRGSRSESHCSSWHFI